MSDGAIKNHAAFIWSVADLLRGDYKQSEYGKVILPLVVLRRLDCVLEPTKDAVLERAAALKGKVENVEPVLSGVTGHRRIYNTSKLDFKQLLDDPTHVADNLRAYIAGFSPAARDVLDKFDFETQIDAADEANLLYLVLGQFAEIDLHPEAVSNLEMGYLYEELIRRFSELSNETAGEHFTPREVIRLMVNLLFVEDDDVLRAARDREDALRPGLRHRRDALGRRGPPARAEPGRAARGLRAGAERRDVRDLPLGHDAQGPGRVAHRPRQLVHRGRPRGAHVRLHARQPAVRGGVEEGREGRPRRARDTRLRRRFGAGLPRINDGTFLFLQHMISKMKPPEQGGSRLAIVFNGSPLFTGAAGSGESEIRRWIIENDWLEAVVALPDQLFYNTGISTYFWVVTNRKAPSGAARCSSSTPATSG